MPRANSPPLNGLLDSWGRRNRVLVDRACEACGQSYRPKRKSSRFCSKRCRWSKNGGQNRKKESWWVNQKGYIEGRVWEEDGTQRRVKQHRFVVEQKLGRRLLPTEDVHHENEIKSDNNPSNLNALEHGFHSGITNKRRSVRIAIAKATMPTETTK
jgi:HNH endonuclease